MPFQVSKVNISFAKYPSYDQFGYLNRADRSKYTAITSSNNMYNQGDSVTINVNNSITLMKAPNTSLQYNFEYILKLFPGYLAFGISSTLSSNTGTIKVILRDITLNIIAYR